MKLNSIIGAALGLALCPPTFAAQATFIDLGTLPTGPVSPNAGAFGLNENGTVVVGYADHYNPATNPSIEQECMRWHANTGIVGFGADSNWIEGVSTSVSPDGATVVGWMRSTLVDGGAPRPFIWTSSTGLNHWTAPGMQEVVSVTNGAQVAFGNGLGGGALRWTPSGGAIPIPGAPGYPFVLVSDGSADGSAAAGLGIDSGGSFTQAIRWSASGGTQLLGIPTGFEASVGSAVSDDGSTVVGHVIDAAGSGIYAFRWTQGSGMTGLGASGAFTVAGIPVDVSTDGSAIAFNQSYAKLWTQTLGEVDLANHLIANGAVIPVNQGLAGRLTVKAMSPDGNAFAGTRDFLDANANWRERAWVAYLTPPTQSLVGVQTCTQTASNSTGAFGQLTAHGSIVAGDNTLRLTASSLPTGFLGLLLTSQGSGLISNPGGSQGDLCLGGGFGRYNNLAAMSDGSGNLTQDLDLLQTPSPQLPVAIVAGETWHFQMWHRDLNPANTSNFTNALAIEFH